MKMKKNMSQESTRKRTKTIAHKRRRRSPSPSPVRETVIDLDPRQLSPSTGDYGMDDHDIDDLEGYEEDEQPGNCSIPTNTTPSNFSTLETPATGNGNDCAGPSRSGGAPCWKHFDKIFDGNKVLVSATCKYCKKDFSAGSHGGTGHLNRHYVACLKKYAMKEQGGRVQTQLNLEHEDDE
jgi:hypothetical protein